MKHKYQLVVQWPAVSLDYDRLIRIEDMLILKEATGFRVDGHDSGSGELNLFIWTDDPHETLATIAAVLKPRGWLDDARVAYRFLDGDTYSVIWPVRLDTVDIR